MKIIATAAALIACLPVAAMQVVTLHSDGPGTTPGADGLYFAGVDAEPYPPGHSSFSALGDDQGGSPYGWRSFASGLRPLEFSYTVSPAGHDAVTPGAAATGRLANTARFVSAIPEPGSYALILAGVVAMGFIWRRRRR